MAGEPTYSVVVPVYNSAPTLDELHSRLVKVMESLGEPFEMILVEDGGRDNGWEILKRLAEQDARVVAVRMMRNFNQSNAVMCGLIQSRGKYIVTIDDDLQNPPEEILVLVKALRENPDAEVVMGIPVEKQHSFIRRLGSDLVGWANSLVFERSPELKLSSFRLMRRSLVDSLESFHLLNASIDAIICSVTRYIINVRVDHHPRKAGESGYGFRRLLAQTINNFIGFSVFPLRMLAGLGLAGVFLNMLYASYILLRNFIWGDIDVPGWMSTIIMLNILSGFTFFAFGMVGEYLLRILHCTSRGASFFIKEIVRRA